MLSLNTESKRSGRALCVVFFSVRKRSDCRGGFGTVSARLRESKAQWPTFRAATVDVYECGRACARNTVTVYVCVRACMCECVCVCMYICRENVFYIIRAFRRLFPRILMLFGGFCLNPAPFGARGGVHRATVIFPHIILSSVSVVAWQLEAESQAGRQPDIPDGFAEGERVYLSP